MSEEREEAEPATAQGEGPKLTAADEPGRGSMKRRAAQEQGEEFLEPRTPEQKENLFWLAAPPGVWVAHLLASYLTAANYCAKAGSETASLRSVRIAIGVYTAVALGALALLTWRGFRHHRSGSAVVPHDFDSRADRHRFLGFTMLLLSAVGILGVVYVAIPVFFMETCR